jgi:multidrug resistance efflux pump
MNKPVIRSFTYIVTPHMPLRGAATKSTTTTAAKSASADQQQNQRGGRGGRGGGSGSMFDEKPGSTRIISILPEGTKISPGQVVCELDSAPFQDELKAQLIRYAQAKSWVDQAHAIYEVNEITYREYREGIHPQDLRLIQQYIETCQIEKGRAERNLAWSRDLFNKGLRTKSQLQADLLADQQTTIALEEAQGMYERLAKFTGPKILKSLEANLKAIAADLKTQEASFELEKQRLARLQKNIAKCTLRAPAEGILVYVSQTNGWGRVTQPIEEGVTVREGQEIFEIPDPKHMRVKAKINETKLAQVTTGQPAIIKVDAFPDRPMRGTVAEVTAISTPVNGPFSDVRIYYATVNIDEGFEELRPGLTAEVFLKAGTRNSVTRVPISAVRSVDGKHYVALHRPSDGSGDDADWQWKRVELGLSDPHFAEVISGLSRGDRVVADPLKLPVTDLLDADQPDANPSAIASLQP